ncbi:MAG: GAF domain-containing protein [Bacteroidota bacterium]
MSRFNFSNHAFQKYLFLLGGIAFVLSLLKNVFLEKHPGTFFYMLEFLSFIFFLAVFYVSDRNNQHLRFLLQSQKIEKDKEIQGYRNRIESLNDIIAAYEEKENEATRFASYQEKVMKQLIKSGNAGKDKHKLLYSLGELFHGMAVVLYKKDEPDGLFSVETTYGVSEDFEIPGFYSGEGLHGEAVLQRMPVLVEPVPENYIEVETALGKSRSYYLYLLPVIKNEECTGLLELLTFKKSRVEDLWPSVMDQLVDKEIL